MRTDHKSARDIFHGPTTGRGLCSGQSPREAGAQANLDLWEAIALQLDRLGRGNVKVTHIYSHLSNEHVESGIIDARDLQANKACDQMADLGAKATTLDQALIDQYIRRWEFAALLQKYMLAVIAKRRLLEVPAQAAYLDPNSIFLKRKNPK